MATTKLRARTAVRSGIVLLATAVVAALTGCSSGGSSSADSGAPTGTLQMIVSSADGSDAGFRAVNAAFEKKYPGVKIQFDTISNANYPSVEASRLTAGKVDLLTAQPLQVPSYAEGSESNDAKLAASGQFVDLTKEPFMKRFTASVLTAQAFNGKDYTMPTGLSYYTGVYYNKAIFAKYGLSVPTTWSEFLKLSATLKADGITPLGIGGKDGWPAGLPTLAAVESAYPTLAERQQLAEDLWKQKVKLTDSTMEGILEKTSTIYSLAQQDFAGVPYASIPGDFAAGDFAMTPDGTWDNAVIASAVGSKFDIGYFPLPMSEKASDNKFLGGKVELRLAVPTSAKNKTAALAYLDFFSQTKNYELFLSHAGFAPSEPGITAGAFLDAISSYTSTFQPAWDMVWTPNNKAGTAAVVPFDYTALTPLGTSTASQAAQSAQAAWAAGF